MRRRGSQSRRKKQRRPRRSKRKKRKRQRRRSKIVQPRRRNESPRVSTAAPVVAGASTVVTDNEDVNRDSTTAAPTHESEATSPTSPKGLKSICSRLKRRSKPAGTVGSAGVGNDKEQGFVGGATLRSSTSQSQAQSHTSPTRATSGDERPHNLGDVEPSTVPHVNELDDAYSDVSSLEEPRGRSKERLTSAPTKASGATEFEEAKDHFDEGLAPPPTFTTDADKETRGSPTRDSKFREMGI
eukprot:GHVO01060024.1.p1 GENE.GHVO01060024.1~~GHVO01060024.1.p1  ORF type:complete len:242 (-),score=20.38 GHVO01060024.1:110-835(-)